MSFSNFKNEDNKVALAMDLKNEKKNKNMREIKFRGKRIDNGKFVEGDLIHGVNHKKGKVYILPIQGGIMALGHGLDPIDGYEVIPETVGQYTGLKDKNLVDIYEGDIVKVINFYNQNILVGAVEWQYNGYYVSSSKNYTPPINSQDHGNNIEVIGNIYQHPQLLK